MSEKKETKGDPAQKVVKPIYAFHKGSIRVSGKSQVFKTGLSAFYEWRKGTRPVEFVFLGGNAGHQAYKAAVVAKREIEATCHTKVAFLPMWSSVITDSVSEHYTETEHVQTRTPDRSGVVKDLSIWRIIEQYPPPKPKNKRRKWKKQPKVTTSEANPPKALTTHKPLANISAALGPVEKGKEKTT